MEQSRTFLDQLLLEVQFSLVTATPEEKERFASKIIPWANQLAEELGIEAKTSTDEGAQDKPKADRSAKPRAIHLQEIQALIEKEVFLKQISETIEHVVWLQDIHSDRIFYVNPAFEKVWGQSCASLYADPLVLMNSVHPEDRLQVMVARPPHDHKTYSQAYRILRPDGSLRWIFARTFLLRGKTGEAVCLFCIAQDITDQKQIELALRKTLDRTREQFDLSRKMSLTRKPEAALRTLMSANELHPAHRAALLYFYNPKIGPAHGVELVSSWQSSHDLQAWPSETGLYEDPALIELFDQNRTTVFQIRSDPRLKDTLRTCLLEGKVQTLIIFPLVASGIWLGNLMAYFDQERQLDHNGLRHLKVLVDQAAVTLFNLQLLEFEEDSRHEAERANEIKTEFLAMISHELRTPLTSIIGFTTTLLAEDVTWEPGEQHDFFLTIQQEADRLEELIEHLLDLSRLEAGMLPISLESISLHDIIKDASSQLQTLTSAHLLNLHIPDNLPPVFGDARRIAQVLVNLVRNASTYSPQGTEICISAMVRGGSMQINVSDEGPGIPPGEFKKVFQAFRRGKNVEKRSPQGAGLGLAICKGLVETQGGRIWIKKKNAPGTTICFTIPLAPMVSQAETINEEK